MVLGIARLLGKTKAADYARDFLKETRARDLTIDNAEKVKTVVKPPTPDVEVNQRGLTSFTKSEEFVKTQDSIMDELRQKVETNPLTMGGKAADNELYGVGPALYDFIVKMPVKKSLPPKEWVNLFKGKLELDYTEPSTGALKKITVPRQELDDAGIAVFDRKNNLQSGILKDLMESAEGKDAMVSKETLLNFVQGSPSNNIKVIKTGTTYIKERADNFIKDLKKLTNDARDTRDVTRGLSYDDLMKKNSSPSSTTDQGSIDFIKKMSNTKENLAHLSFMVTSGLSRGGKAYDEDSFNYAKNVIESLKTVEGIDVNKIQKLEATNKALLSVFDKGTIANNFRRHEKGKNVSFTTEHHDATGYRILGPEDYFEDKLYVDDRIISALPDGVKRLYNPAHFGKDPTGKDLAGQIMHIRGGTRSVRGIGNQKATVFDEAQSDLNQNIQKDAVRIRDNFVNKLINTLPEAEQTKLFKLQRTNIEKFQKDPNVKNFSNDFYNSDTFKNMRSNPFNRKNLKEMIHKDKLYNIGDEMMTIAQKGRYQTQADIEKFNKLADEGDFLRSQTIDQSAVKMPTSDNVTYNPFMDKKEWAGLGIKYLLKKAANKGDDWVAVNPYERVAYKRMGDRDKVGLLEFYGNKSGNGSAKNLKLKGGKRDMSPKVNEKGDIVVGPATIPSQMRQLAKKYDTEVRTIEVAKSDPNKPYKLLDYSKNEIYDVDVGKKKDTVEHVAAFETLEDVPYSFRDQIVKIDKGDDALYYETYAIKVKPEMKDMPMSTYKKGGLVIDLFKWG